MSRTKTYIAGDWTGDKVAIDQLYYWNNHDYWGLSFSDAHELTQARDSSLPCSIKSSLWTRLEVSKTFILVVGDQTKGLRNGSCQYCASLNSYTHSCARGHSVDYRSYIEYECEKAVNDGIKIVVLYYAASINKDKCPDAVRYTGTHVPMCHYVNGKYEWDYQTVKRAMQE